MLFRSGYDFQVDVNESCFLAEVKGIREKKGKFKLTNNEYEKALEYKNEYIITLVMNLNDIPTFLTIDNPANSLKFEKKIINPKSVTEYHLVNAIC